MRVLLVEDDPMIGDAVCLALKDASYAVDWVRDGEEAESAIQYEEHQAILLDLSLPGRSGLELLSALRMRGSSIPVIIITARDGLQERVKGLDSGADDYLVKPFDLDELLARLRAVTRRKGRQASGLIGNGQITLDPAMHTAFCGDSRAVLSSREFAVLHALLLQPGWILSRSELEERVYGWDEVVESNAIDYLIHQLRRKLGATSIKNIRGAGWMVEKQK
ncbi:MAG: response regulator transcription factor [Chlorobiales bacterium]|nr:response regulator transcription factor [Chlorobiales bacterium]